MPFLIADVNQDGRTDVIYHDGTDLVTKDLVNSKELNRKPMPTEYLNLLKVDLETSLLQIITRTAKDDRLKLVDLKTLAIVWDVHMPSGTYFNGLLSGGQPDEANLFAAVPRALSTTDHCTIRTTATAAEYLGKDTAIRNQIGLTAVDPVEFANDRFVDPRMIEPLPWAGGYLPDFKVTELLQMAPNSLLIVLGAFVFPFFFIRSMFLQRRWSLQSFLLLPMLFVVPYLVLHLPLEGPSYIRADESARAYGWQLWMWKLWIVSLMLPNVVFVAAWIKHLWHREWKWLIGLSIAAILFSILAGAQILWGRDYQCPTGSHYDWHDWGTVYLILYGSWYVGWGVFGIWILMTIGRFVIQSVKRIFRQPKLATS